MSVGLIPLVIAAIGAAYAAIALRGARRRDSVLFGLLVLTDAVMCAWRGLNVVTGGTIIDHGVTIPCAAGTVLLAYLTLEFLAAFPGRAPMRWRTRSALIAWCAATLAWLAQRSLAPGNSGVPAESIALEVFFFAPVTILIFLVGWDAYRKTSKQDARIVIGVLWFRWGVGFAAYTLGPALDVFEAAVWAETTVATTLSVVVIGTVALRTELFSLRSAASEVLTIASLALLVLLGTGGALAAALAYVPAGQMQYVALYSASLVSVALTAVGFAIYPRVERRVLAGLDDRRARRLGVQGEPIPVDAPAAIAEATQRITTIGDDARVRWLPARDVPASVAQRLADGAPLRRTDHPDAPAELVVPALGGDRALVGAFTIDGGTIDRDTYLVARDLAARVALVVERANAVSALEDARRLAALGQFAAAIAHDIRTPLTSISLNVQILRRKLQLSDDDREHLDIALEELGRLDRSVAEILDFAKPVKLSAEQVDVGELIEDAAKGLTPVLSERGLVLACEPQPDLMIQGDPQRLRQVVANLVGNAADASSPGATVTLRAAPATDGQIAIEVEDRGKGIDADALAHIFEPFFTTRPDGTGLGLAIVQKVVRAHGGDVRVRSMPGGGSTFTVMLPAAG